MNCRKAREKLDSFLAGAAPELESHLAACDSCAEALVEALLREPALAPVPAGFAVRVSAQMRTRSIDPDNVLPYFGAAALVLFAALSAYILLTGTGTHWLESAATRQVVWLATGAVETAICFLFRWRTARAR